MDVMPSPIRGADGNVEFLVHARRDARAVRIDDVGALIDAAVDEATRRLR
jgi:hypothetical protein